MTYFIDYKVNISINSAFNKWALALLDIIMFLKWCTRDFYNIYHLKETAIYNEGQLPETSVADLRTKQVTR